MRGVTGLDLSLTATGIAYHDGTTQVIKTSHRGVARLQYLRDAIVDEYLLDETLVVVEGYAFGQSRSTHNHALGELGGVVRLAMHEVGITWVDVPPASLKKYATGKGNAGKAEVLAESIRRLGYAGSNDNEADALWLRAMGMEALGMPVVDVPKAHREALVKVPWPELAR